MMAEETTSITGLELLYRGGDLGVEQEMRREALLQVGPKADLLAHRQPLETPDEAHAADRTGQPAKDVVYVGHAVFSSEFLANLHGGGQPVHCVSPNQATRPSPTV